MTDTQAPPSATPTAPPKKRLAYNPSIDGLRGLAVSTMLLYHLDVSWMGDGGPISLEVFFVVSGFLITTLFIHEFERDGRIDRPDFWRRRFRRLAPALLAMVAFVALWALVPGSWGPTDGQRAVLRPGGIASLTYTSNWYFVFSGQSYFEGFGAPSPLRHTWSLSMEEQFYLLIAMGVAFGFRRWHPHRQVWLWVTGGLTVASAAWMAFLWRMGDLTASGLWPLGIDPASLPEWARTFFNFQGSGDPTRMYFGTDTRLGAALAGAFLAFLCERRQRQHASMKALNFAGLFGVAGLVLLYAVAPDHWSFLYLGGYLFVEILTMLALWVATAPRPNTWQQALAWPPLVKVGMLSYSLYVWHYPIFLLLNEDRVPLQGLAFDAVRVAAAGVVAWLSFHYLEQPIRKGGLGTGWRFRFLVAAVPLVVIGFVAITSIPRSSTDALTSDVEIADQTRLAPDGRKVVMVAGDSMARTFGVNVAQQQLDKPAGIQVRLATKLGCGITIADFMVNGTPQLQGKDCKNWPKEYTQLVDAISPSVTLALAWGWEIYDRRVPNAAGDITVVKAGSEQWSALLSGAIDQMAKITTAKGGKLVLLTMPCIDYTAPTPRHPTTKEARDPERVEAVNRVIRDYQAKHPRTVSIIDLNGFLCPDGEHYRAVIDGKLVSDDGIHFTPEGAAIVWQWMLPDVKKLAGIP